MEKKLPKGWVETTLGGIAETAKKSNPKEKEKESFKYVDISSINSDSFKIESPKFLLGKDAPSRARQLILTDDILVSTVRPNLKRIALVSDELDHQIASTGFAVIRPIKVLSAFVFYHAISNNFIENLVSLQRGASYPAVRNSDVFSQNIPLPPLAEQKRIVAKLDTLFGHLEKLKTKLDRIPGLLKDFRQSVLTQAVTGKLTEEWRKGKKLAKWEKTFLSELVLDKPRNGFSPRGVKYETPVKSLTLSATTSGKFDGSFVKYLDIEIPAEDSHLWLKKGDILIQRSNTLEYVGTSAIYDREDSEFIYPDLMMKVKVNEKVINSFLNYSLSEESTKNYFRQNATGTAGNMPKINQQVVLKTPVNLPPFKEQTEIVRRVESLFSKADRIASQYEDLKKQIEVLPQAILAKAFRGELVEQLPGDGDAAGLLEEIRALREAMVLNKKKTSKRKRKK